jgi:phosphoribosylformimino-5-aminoimidazole carboxamide ribotide isomerase
VRLWRGEMTRATVYSSDPAAQARAFVAAGCRWLHVVDLDGAVAGKPVNSDAVAGIVAAVDVPVQLGGGVRDLKTIEMWLDRGVERVIIGTAAVADPHLVRAACRARPGRIAVGIDARNGKVATDGWSKTSKIAAHDLALRFEDAGVAAIIYTDIARDGTLAGVNFAAIESLSHVVTTPIIASGGVASIEDLKTLKTLESSGVAGVIVGRAFYDGRIDPAAAITVMAQRE